MEPKHVTPRQKYLNALSNIENRINQLKNFQDYCEHAEYDRTEVDADQLEAFSKALDRAAKIVSLDQFGF